jgi:hypothetical protein
MELFVSQDTFADDMLAAHYGGGMPRPGPGDAKWVSYGGSNRKGILSHGAFLSAGNSVADTSTTLRGKHIREQLLCEELPLATPELLRKLNMGMDVDTTMPPEAKPGECRPAVLKRTLLSNGCEVCHNRMDPIGLGLENFDMKGRFRTNEQATPSCRIAGEGQLAVGEAAGTVLKPFSGPAGLSDLLMTFEKERLGRCAVKRFLQFSAGREVHASEEPLVDAMAGAFRAGGYKFDDLLLGHVAAAAFGYRTIE